MHHAHVASNTAGVAKPVNRVDFSVGQTATPIAGVLTHLNGVGLPKWMV